MNFFVSEKLNKLTLNRTNKEWLDAQLKNGNSYIIPVSDSKILMSKDNNKVVYFNIKDFNTDNNFIDNLVFIGELKGNYYFAFDVNSHSIHLKTSLEEQGDFLELRRIAPLLDHDAASVLSIAKSMTYWHANHQFCGTCGHKTYSTDAGYKRICSNSDCRNEHFPRTDPAIIVLVSKDDKCLLARQAKWRKKQYATIAGFVEPGETLEQAVAREVFEETGVMVDEAFYHSSQPWPFPGTIMLGFLANANTTQITLHDNELEDAKWLSRDEIKQGLSDGSLLLSPSFSVSFRLIESWFDKENSGELRRIISSL